MNQKLYFVLLHWIFIESSSFIIALCIRKYRIHASLKNQSLEKYLPHDPGPCWYIWRTPRLFKNFTVIRHVVPNYEFEEPCIESLEMTPLELLCKDYHGIFRWFWDFPKFNFRLVLKPPWFLFCSFEDSLFPLSHPVTVFTQESKRMKSGMKGQKNITWLSMKFQSDHEYYSKFPKFQTVQNFQPWRPLKIRTQEGKGWKKNQETVSGFVKTFFCSNHF